MGASSSQDDGKRTRRKMLGEEKLRLSFPERWDSGHSGFLGLNDVLDLLQLFHKEGGIVALVFWLQRGNDSCLKYTPISK